MTMTASALRAGTLRHRIAIDRQDQLQNGVTGEITQVWTEIAASVPAAVEPLSGREFIAANQKGSKITARITVRFGLDLNTAMRIRHGAAHYRIQAILPDNRSGREWQTLLVESE